MIQLAKKNEEKWSTWLKTNAPELQKLSYVRPTINQFTMRWIMFEVKKRKGINELGEEKFYEQLVKNNLICNKAFEDALQHFIMRYSKEGRPNVDALRIGRSCDEDLVTKVLGNEELSPEKSVIAVFIILTHYRNRLVHGEKFIKGKLPHQLENFTHANNVLMETILLLE